MSRVLITAFGPYGGWLENSSWLALVELTRNLPPVPEITTRLYPVDLAIVSERLAQDLPGHDYAIHLGQAPGATSVQLEAIGLNVGGGSGGDSEELAQLTPDGPTAYRSELPLVNWANLLRTAGIPARVSYFAGTYLCNATLYLTHYLCEKNGWPTQATFVHLPLTVAQAVEGTRGEQLPSMPSTTAAEAIRTLLEQMAT